MTKEIQEARKLVEKSDRILVFTGPGISAASGIPCSGSEGLASINADMGGNRDVYAPVEYQQFVDSTMYKQIYWKFLLANYPLYKAAVPNPSHYAIKKLEDKGKVLAVITQNEDSLHRLAGSDTDRLIELHGTWLFAECFDCYDWTPLEESIKNFAKDEFPPMCHCGGWLKPSLVMNGELPERENLIKAFQAADQCDLVISIGSSLRREPSSSVPLAAKAYKKPYIIINPGKTAHDLAADIKIEGDAAKILPEIFA